MTYFPEREFMTIFLTLWPLMMLCYIATNVAIYVLNCFGLYSMANNTGMKSPWLSWIPICDSFVLGSLADRYNLNAYQKQTKYRILLVVMRVIMFPVTYIMIFATTFAVAMVPSDQEILGALGGILVSLFIVLAVSIAVTIIQLICYHKVFMDFEPGRATLYTVAAFFGFGFIPIFIARNNVPVGVAGVCNPKQPHYDTNTKAGQNPGGYGPI